jgi:hypothetical protein
MVREVTEILGMDKREECRPLTLAVEMPQQPQMAKVSMRLLDCNPGRLHRRGGGKIAALVQH